MTQLAAVTAKETGPKGAPTFKIETITPKLAAKYLEANKGNRPLTRATARNYAEEIRLGQWLFNGEAIKFDSNGVLVDGQHRLLAVTLADRSIDTLVIRGLDPEAFKTLDTGRQRSMGDVLALRGILYPASMSSAYRFLYRWLGRGKKKTRISNTQLLEFVDEFPEMIELGYECLRKPLDADLVEPARRIFFYFMASRVDTKVAREFMQCLARPNAPLVPNARKLRDRLQVTSEEAFPPAAGVKWLWLLQAWNATVAGKPVDRFSRFPDAVDFERHPLLKMRAVRT